ncbi:hypothetical protein GCM10023228_31690 [Brevibacillus fulvus]
MKIMPIITMTSTLKISCGTNRTVLAPIIAPIKETGNKYNISFLSNLPILMKVMELVAEETVPANLFVPKAR